MFDAVVMAGGGKQEPLTEQEGVSNKAFILLNGRPILSYILDALSNSPSIEKIAVVGPERELAELQQQGYSFVLVKETGGMLDNLGNVLKEVDQERLCLIVTGDIPLITEEVVEGYLHKCSPYEGDFYYPILTKESCESRFPETKRTYVKLREGSFTGGNVGLLSPGWFTRNRHRLEMFIAYRKKPLKLLRIMPPSIIIKFLFKRLSVSDLEQTLSKIMALRAKAVPCDYVEIGTDVDKISDLEVVRRSLTV